MKKIFFMIALLIIPLLFSGCGMKNRAYETYILDVDWANEPDVKETINQSIIDLADQLLLTSKIDKKSKVTITSFVDLHQLNKTTHFGRKVSESFFSELHKRGLSLVDARGTKSIRVNADGEFFITRDIKLLNNKRFENSYILVGTYTRFGKGVMINVRILDNQTGDVVSVGRSIIDINYCDIFENCPKKETEKKDEIIVKKTAEVKVVKRMISISDAGCSYVDCPENCVDSDCYKYNKKPQTLIFKEIKKQKQIQKQIQKQTSSCQPCKIGSKK